MAKEAVLGKSMFWLSNGATAFAAEVLAIKEEITDALKRGLREIDVYLDSRLALEALNSLVPRHGAIAEIKEMIKYSGVKNSARWIRAHVDHPGNERADELAKAATEYF